MNLCPSSNKRLIAGQGATILSCPVGPKLNKKLMMCYKIHITPSKICCLGPEEEVSNYVVKPDRKYASDFARVTFLDEDWTKLFPMLSLLELDVICPRTDEGSFPKP